MSLNEFFCFFVFSQHIRYPLIDQKKLVMNVFRDKRLTANSEAEYWMSVMSVCVCVCVCVCLCVYMYLYIQNA